MTNRPYTTTQQAARTDSKIPTGLIEWNKAKFFLTARTNMAIVMRVDSMYTEMI